MTMERQNAMSACAASVTEADTGRAPGRRLVRDDRGAIMVMGIFMCTFLVGALWYIAGIGDALIFHERLQESADSVAFSAAIIDARGMNIIVLMNLLMAAILAIRVAINLLKTVCIVAAAIFLALSFVPFCEWAGAISAACGDAAETLQDADDETRQPIDDALEALNTAEKGVALATPAAAWAGGYEMADKYTPPLQYILLSGSTVGSNGYGLPIEDGTLPKLCTEAATGVADILTAFIPSALSGVASTLQGLIVGITANDFFCELGSGDATPPNFSSQLAASNQQGCQGKLQTLQNTLSADQATLASAQRQLASDQAAAGYTNGNPPSSGPSSTVQADQNTVNNDQNTVNNDQSAVDNFDMNQCEQQLAQQQSAAQQAAQNKANNASDGSSSSSDGGDKCPAQVCVDSNNGCNGQWYNGIKDAQISSLGNSSNAFANTTNYSSKFVNIAAGGKNTAMSAPSVVQQLSFAQAEFYYDCSGGWTGNACDNDQNAMWNFHWRARFRLINYGTNLEGSGLQAYDYAMRAKLGLDAGNALASSASSGLPGVQADAARLQVLSVLGSQQLSLH